MNSATILNILLIGTLCLGFATAKSNNLAKLRADNSLMEFMLNTRAVQAKAPLRSMQCFNYYTPLLNEITTKYEDDYEACLKASDDSLKQLDDASSAQKKNLNNLATSSCSAIANCYALSDAISSFECYAGVSSTNTKDFYSISDSASEELLNLRELYRQIELSEYRCTNASERAYVKSTADTYEEMQSCLAGHSAVPTTTTTTTTTTTEAPTTTTTTTVAPTTASTTVAPTTEASTESSSSSEVPTTEGASSEASPTSPSTQSPSQ